MEELAAVPEATEARLLVILADVGREVGDGDGTDVGGGFDGADLADGRVGIFGDEGLVVGGAFVGAGVGVGVGVSEGGGGRGCGGVGTRAAEEGAGARVVEPVGLLGGVVGGVDVCGARGGVLGG